MPMLKKLAQKFIDGDEDAGEELELMAPKGVLDDMSVDEFAKKMTEDKEFADDIYSRMEGSKYGSELSPDTSDEEGDRKRMSKGRVLRVVEQFMLPADDASNIADALSDLLHKVGGNPGPKEEY